MVANRPTTNLVFCGAKSILSRVYLCIKKFVLVFKTLNVTFFLLKFLNVTSVCDTHSSIIGS